MNYDEEYFIDISRYFPFNYFFPLTKKISPLESFVLKTIQAKEELFAWKRKKFLKDLGVKSVLDVGCSSGELVKSLLSDKIDAYGVDISNFQINRLSKKYNKRFLTASANNLPFPDKKIDAVTAFHLLEHIPENEISDTLGEFARVSNSFILIELPTSQCINAKTDPTHISVFSNDKWLRIIKQELGHHWEFKRIRRATPITPLFLILNRK